MAQMTNKRKASKTKSHVSSDEEDVLVTSEEEAEFLDQSVVQKAKKTFLSFAQGEYAYTLLEILRNS